MLSEQALVNRQGEAYVITGPIYRPSPSVPPLATNKPHRVPDGFFKIVYFNVESWSCDEDSVLRLWELTERHEICLFKSALNCFGGRQR